jgi:hypothetical protein
MQTARGANHPGITIAADELLFNETERAPSDNVKLQFEAVLRFPDDEKNIVKALLEQ